MYHPATIAAREAQILARPEWRTVFPDGIPTYAVEDSRYLTQELTRCHTEAGWTRKLSPEESLFLAATPLRCAIDFPYFAERFIKIDDEGHGLRGLYPMWESQTFVLDQLAKLERARWGSHPDGLLLNVLKARQLGVSTLSESLIAHRIFFQPYTRGLSGADVEEQAGYLFRMVSRIYDHLPFFLQPAPRFPFVKNREMGFGNQSFLKTGWGKSTRGALQSVTGQEGSKGAIGRGQTFSVVHISELATWDNPEQLDTALFPAIPVNPDTLGLLESTAEHAGDWWHLHWQISGEGLGRFLNVFIPWAAEPSKYSLPAPGGWIPSTATLAHAKKAEQELQKWMGRRSTLTREQLYWYEQTRALYEKKGDLGGFLKEYPADDKECFQYSGKAIFTFAQLDQIDQAGSKRPLLDVWRVEPAREIAELRRQPEEGAPQPKRITPPLSMRIPSPMSAIAQAAYPVPPGYGFQRLTPGQLKELPSLRHSVMAIWEYPRARGKRRYVMAVDVSDGLGADYSIVDVIRMPTIEEPAEQIAQYVSNTIDTKQLAFVCDAIGRLYPDEDAIESLAAIETNSHGLATQDSLQLHLGYSHFYVWEYADSASPDRRYSTKIGWVTTTRTRPIFVEYRRSGLAESAYSQT